MVGTTEFAPCFKPDYEPVHARACPRWDLSQLGQASDALLSPHVRKNLLPVRDGERGHDATRQPRAQNSGHKGMPFGIRVPVYRKICLLGIGLIAKARQ